MANRTALPTLVEVEDFIRAFVAAEALVASHIGPTHAVLIEKVRAVNPFFDSEHLRWNRVNHGRFNDDLTPEQRALEAQGLATVVVRRIFKIERIANRTFGALFRCYLGDCHSTGDETSWDMLLFVARRGERLAIVSKYHGCLDCEATGIIQSGPHKGYVDELVCGGVGFTYASGAEFKLSPRTRVVQTARIEARTKPSQAAKY